MVTPGTGSTQALDAAVKPVAPAAPPPTKIYLETYLETVSHLPYEVQRILNTLKDIDLRSQDLQIDAARKAEECLELPPNCSRNTTDEQKQSIASLRQEVDKIHEVLRVLANEKVELAKKALEILDGHVEQLDEELVKFEQEITLSTAQAELQQLHQQQAQQQAQREKSIGGPLGSAGSQKASDDPIKQGDQVAARISAPGAPDEWILARVMNISNNGSTFTILDEDAEEGGTSSIHHLPQKQIIRLPKAKEKKNARTFQDGAAVLAVFPNTTMFYRAYVTSPARWQAKNSVWGYYLLAFDDDEDPATGFQANREVAFQYVVPLPVNFKLA